MSEGQQYRIGQFRFEGNARVSAEALAALFKVRSGDVYNESAIRRGFEDAREIYGAGGYFEFTAYPDLTPRDDEPIVDVTVRIQEGRQYFVNRISFAANTYTRDDVIRRELMLVEADVFNTEALKVQHSAAQPARVLQAARGRGHQRREDAGTGRPRRRPADAPGTEPQPDQLRRGSVAVRGHLRQRVVHDNEPVRTPRERDGHGPEGRPLEPLPARLHRAVFCSTGRSAPDSACTHGSSTTTS